MMAVTTNLTSGFRPGAPRMLWVDTYMLDPGGAGGTPNYDVSPEGDFIMIQSTLAGQSRVGLVLNWAEELWLLAAN